MDNARKIKEEKTNEVQVFLKDDLLPSFSKAPDYSLDTEFARTRKNRSFKTYVIIAFFVAFVVAAAALLLYFYNQNRIIEIDINDFQDINLTELLNNAKKNEAKLIALKEELENYKQEMNLAVYNIKDETSREIELLVAKNVPEKDREAVLTSLKQTEKSKLSKVIYTYTDKIDSKQKEIAAVQKEVDNYNLKIANDAQRVENVISNYQRIHDFQMKKQKSFYEKKIESMREGNVKQLAQLKKYYQEYADSLILKFNPVLDADEVKNALSAELTKDPDIKLDALNADLSYEGIMTTAEFEKLKQVQANYKLLSQKMAEIPYVNTIPQILSSLSGYFDAQTAAVVEVMKRSAAVVSKKDSKIREKNAQVRRYQEAVGSLAQDEKESGYIIYSDGSGIEAVIHDGYSLTADTRAMVFRNEKEFIATALLKKDGDTVRVEVLEKAKGKELRPFDKIVIILK